MLVFAMLHLVHDEVRLADHSRRMDEREKKIADGLAAAEKGQKELSEAQSVPTK